MTTKQAKQKRQNRLGTVLAILIFLLGLGILFYPVASDLWNQHRQNQLISHYTQSTTTLAPEDHSALWEAAQEYNKNLSPTFRDAFTGRQLPAGDPYWGLLDPDGSGIMGYIEIPRISVRLPIYHGTSDSVLQIAAGHLEGTSLPVGGASTHAVISAHRGLPSAKLFTNLDQLEVGDTFTITVLDRVLTYEVDKISIVLPTETDELKIAEGKDYVTLMTCTPYGINTHRLLVRGRRVETPDQYKHLRVTAEALKIEPIIVAPIMALPMLLILLIGMLISTRKPKKTRGEEHEKH